MDKALQIRFLTIFIGIWASGQRGGLAQSGIGWTHAFQAFMQQGRFKAKIHICKFFLLIKKSFDRNLYSKIELLFLIAKQDMA